MAQLLPPPKQTPAPPDYERIATQLDRIAAMMRMAGRTAAAESLRLRAAEMRADLSARPDEMEFRFRL
ncbi:MAG TPA: hypothetical protein VHC42_02445 [Rhizomicrobium sp.]|nr:hypothetical protein [Rhizomicrobium sp.]